MALICTLELNMHIVFLCECNQLHQLCLVLHLLYRFKGNFTETSPFNETFSFSVCALHPGLSLQIPGPFAETAVRTMWFYSETSTSRPPHIRTTPGKLHIHLQMHPQTHLQNEQSSWVPFIF